MTLPRQKRFAFALKFQDGVLVTNGSLEIWFFFISVSPFISSNFNELDTSLASEKLGCKFCKFLRYPRKDENF